MNLVTQERIKSRCGDVMRTLPGGGQAPELPAGCDLGLDRTTMRTAAARVKAIPQLAEELTRMIVDIDQKQALFSRTRRDAKHLRERLESY
jgi:hypothetical protein